MPKVDISGKGTLELTDGIFRMRWNEGVTVEEDDALQSLSALESLGKGQPLPILVHVTGVSFSHAARKVPAPPSRLSRIAILGSSPVDQVIAMFVFKVVRLPFPIKYFTSARAALAWLRSN